MMLKDLDRYQILDMMQNIYQNVSDIKNIEMKIILSDGSQEKLYVK